MTLPLARMPEPAGRHPVLCPGLDELERLIEAEIDAIAGPASPPAVADRPRCPEIADTEPPGASDAELDFVEVVAHWFVRRPRKRQLLQHLCCLVLNEAAASFESAVSPAGDGPRFAPLLPSPAEPDACPPANALAAE